MCLKLRAIKSLGVTVSVSPDKFIQDCKDEVALKEVVDQLPSIVQFSQWKRAEVEGKKKMKILSFNLEKEKFRDTFQKGSGAVQGPRKESSSTLGPQGTHCSANEVTLTS